jgi:AcrR family transcriptional regulator
MPASRRQRRPPPRSTLPKLSKREITAAAIEIADEQGLPAVSMRNVASAIGSGAMSLYRHVANRDELLDAMLDAVYSDLDLPTSADGDWRTQLELIARAQRRMLRSHPWVAPLVGSRPPLLLSFLRSFDASLRALLDAGLEITDAATVSATINAFVVGHALLEHSEQEARRRTGLTKKQWRARTAPLVRRILESGDYPAVAQYVRYARDIDPDTAFERALAGILDNAAAQAQQRPAEAKRPRIGAHGLNAP